MKMKKFFTLILAAVLLLPCLLIPAFADDSITAEEAEELILKAYSLSVTVNMGYSVYFDTTNIKKEIEGSGDFYSIKTNYRQYVFGEGFTWIIYGEKARQILNDEAHRIYTDDIAESSWRKNALDNTKPTVYAANESDVTDEYADFISQQAGAVEWCGNPFSPLKKTSDNSSDPYYCLRSRLLTFAENGNGQASAEVILDRAGMKLYENDADYGFELSTVPVTVNVLFTKTASGWRISGGEFVNAMCNYRQTKYKKIVPYNEYHFWIQEKVVGLELSNNFYSPPDKRLIGAKVTYISENRIKYIFTIDWTSSDGKIIKGDYTAYFKSISKSEFEKDYAGKEDLIADTSPDGRYLVFYGGGLYDLLVNGNPDAEQYHGESAPYTGDESIKEIIIFTSVAITAACACLCVIRKRKKIEE